MSHRLRRNTKQQMAAFQKLQAKTKPFERMTSAHFIAMAASDAVDRSADRPSAPKRKTPEDDLQMECAKIVAGLEVACHDLAFMFHTPNGGARCKRTRGRLKAMGTRPGVPDWLLPLPSGRYIGLAIEMKSPSGALSKDQKVWLSRLADAGYLTGTARTTEEFTALLFRYLDAGQSRASALLPAGNRPMLSIR
ncbi:MAG: hypothetical protein DDT34_01159 [Firmicutes bacterium]|nr:hypothetical protein [Bacillota bacterium]